MEDILYKDPEIGDVLFKYNPRAKKYIIRMRPDRVTVTIPLGGDYPSAERFFKTNRDAIRRKVQLLGQRPINSMSPADEFLLRQRALKELPSRLERLAQEHGFKYESVKISKSRTRWGSCSSKATINLSFYLVLLPDILIEYVLLHELCHTVEMNHGPAFWALLDKYTGGKAKELRDRLRAVRNE